MILLPRAVRVFVATTPTSLRRSFDGLANEVRCLLREDPISGHLFVFLNRRRNQVKILVWTRGGYTILHKRLERGTFAFAANVTPTATSVEIGAHELSMLLEGLDLRMMRAKPRWSPREIRTPTELG
jgi:transposase